MQDYNSQVLLISKCFIECGGIDLLKRLQKYVHINITELRLIFIAIKNLHQNNIAVKRRERVRNANTIIREIIFTNVNTSSYPRLELSFVGLY